MSSQRHLITLALGPVQGFISAARRTRDLWYGSYILSDVSRAAALFLRKQGAQLIFPSLDEDPDKELQKLSETEVPRAPRVVNKITAIVETSDMRSLADRLKQAAIDRYRALGSECLVTLRRAGCITDIDEIRYENQLDQTLEAYPAWCEFPESGDYKRLSDELNRLLAARKTTREFTPHQGTPGLLLSSLDGERESVLESKNRSKNLRARFQIDETEALDSVGLIKRVNGKGHHFPAVTRVALQPWFEKLTEAESKTLKKRLVPLMDRLCSEGIASKTNWNRSFILIDECDQHIPVQDPFRQFNYDSELLLKHRLQAALRDYPDCLDLLDLKRLLDENSLPSIPEDGLYVALILADGDRMGTLLDGITSWEKHRDVSRCLSRFAANVEAIVAQHGGACIYSGGDDVLALLPITTAIGCSRNLAESFVATMGSVIPRDMPLHEHPTLSVGIGFGHALSPLAELRQTAAEAEKLAKRGPDELGLRNALALGVRPRGQEPVFACGRWSDDTCKGLEGFDRRIEYWRDCFKSKALSRSAGYDLYQLASELDGGMLVAEARRLLVRRQKRIDPGAPRLAEAIADYLQGIPSEAYARLAQEWYVARWLRVQQERFERTPSIPSIVEAAP